MILPSSSTSIFLFTTAAVAISIALSSCIVLAQEDVTVVTRGNAEKWCDSQVTVQVKVGKTASGSLVTDSLQSKCAQPRFYSAPEQSLLVGKLDFTSKGDFVYAAPRSARLDSILIDVFCEKEKGVADALCRQRFVAQVTSPTTEAPSTTAVPPDTTSPPPPPPPSSAAPAATDAPPSQKAPASSPPVQQPTPPDGSASSSAPMTTTPVPTTSQQQQQQQASTDAPQSSATPLSSTTLSPSTAAPSASAPPATDAPTTKDQTEAAKSEEATTGAPAPTTTKKPKPTLVPCPVASNFDAVVGKVINTTLKISAPGSDSPCNEAGTARYKLARRTRPNFGKLLMLRPNGDFSYAAPKVPTWDDFKYILLCSGAPFCRGTAYIRVAQPTTTSTAEVDATTVAPSTVAPTTAVPSSEDAAPSTVAETGSPGRRRWRRKRRNTTENDTTAAPTQQQQQQQQESTPVPTTAAPTTLVPTTKEETWPPDPTPPPVVETPVPTLPPTSKLIPPKAIGGEDTTTREAARRTPATSSNEEIPDIGGTNFSFAKVAFVVFLVIALLLVYQFREQLPRMIRRLREGGDGSSSSGGGASEQHGGDAEMKAQSDARAEIDVAALDEGKSAADDDNDRAPLVPSQDSQQQLQHEAGRGTMPSKKKATAAVGKGFQLRGAAAKHHSSPPSGAAGEAAKAKPGWDDDW